MGRRVEKVVSTWNGSAYASAVTTRFVYLVMAAIALHTGGLAASPEYFPPGFDPSYYTRDLAAMKEPSIFELRADRKSEVYRFSWFRSFHHPLVVRLEKRGEGGSLRLVQFRRIDKKPQQLVEEKIVNIDAKAWAEFTNKVDQSAFWTTPSQVKQDLGTDGSRWILEGVRSGTYHVIDRWSPTEFQAFKPYVELCLSFLQLAGFKTAKDDFY